MLPCSFSAAGSDLLPRSDRGIGRGDRAADIATTLRAEIIAGRVPAGTVLRQQHLAARFRVSRIPVREALRRLEAEGLLLVRPNRGATVVPLSIDDLQEVYEMRAAAEVLALRIAIPEMTDRQIEQASTIQRQLEEAPIERFGALNTEFHMALYAPCGRPRLLSHITNLGHAADRYLRIGAGSLGHAARSHREHRVLVSACHRRDALGAATCLQKHIDYARKMMIARLTGLTGK